jgi:phage gpG-like protein
MANNSINDIVRAKLDRVILGLPKVVGNEAVQWSQERFLQQNWIGESTEPWQARQKETRKTAGRKLLIQTSRLFRSIRIVEQNANTVVIGTDVPYAAIHNYGGVIRQSARSETFARDRILRGKNKGRFKKMKVSAFRAGSSHGFSFGARVIIMPQRQFIGNSPALKSRLIDKAKAYITSNLK